MKLIIKLIEVNPDDGSKEVLTIIGNTASNTTTDLRRLWDAEHLINESNGKLRCHIEVVE